MRVVVTGGAGFIGSHVAEHFCKGHNEVVVCDNLSRSEILGTPVGDRFFNWNYLQTHYPRTELYQTDIRDFKALSNAAKKARIIVHAAAQVAVSASVKDPRTDFETNAVGTFNVLEAARRADSSVVFCSTNKVYGENVNAIPVLENTERFIFDNGEHSRGIPESFSIDHTGHSPYGTSKLSADLYVQDFAHTYGLKTGVFRMSCIYGERQFGVEDQGWLAWFIIATLTGKPVRIFGNGKQVRDVLYVKDLVNAFDRFLESKLKLGVFNMGGGPKNTLSLLQLLAIIKDETGKSPRISYMDWRPADQKVYVSDIRKAERELGWKPSVSPIKGVKILLDWVQENLSFFPPVEMK